MHSVVPADNGTVVLITAIGCCLGLYRNMYDRREEKQLAHQGGAHHFGLEESEVELGVGGLTSDTSLFSSGRGTLMTIDETRYRDDTLIDGTMNALITPL